MLLTGSNSPDTVDNTKETLTHYRSTIATVALCAILATVFWLETKYEVGVTHGRLINLQTLVAFGAASKNLIFAGDFYRFMSTGFISDSLGLLALNLVFLLISGSLLERQVGSGWLLAVFFIGNFCGAFFAVIFSERPFIHIGSIYAITTILIAQSIAAPSKEGFGLTKRLKNKYWSALRPQLLFFLPFVYFKMNPSTYAAGLIAAAFAGVGCGILLLYAKRRDSRLIIMMWVVVTASLATSLYATYEIFIGFHDYGYLQYAAPAEKIAGFMADIQRDGRRFIASYPFDPVGYAMTAEHALEKKDYGAAETLAQKGLSLHMSIDNPKMLNVKLTLITALALSLKGEAKEQDAKEQAKVPCAAGRTFARVLRQHGLCG